jgi:flagellar biosynthesis anti-sigma factor FlgM
MRIDLNSASQALLESNRSNAASDAAAGNSSPSNGLAGLGGEDQAELSGAHVQAQALVAQAAQLPEVRQERVQSLRQAIQSGRYQSSLDEVAGAVVAHMMAWPAA